jgi:hypothetical protein
MPYKSQAQAGYFHTHKAQLERQGVDVGEWDAATKGKHLPRRAAVRQKTVNLGSKGSFKEKPGALHRDLGIPLGEKIPKSVEEEKAHGSGVTARRARAALGFRAMHHGK